MSPATTQEELFIVAGLGRCGSTMVMRMLHAGGHDVIADSFLSYETTRVRVAGWPDIPKHGVVKAIAPFLPPVDLRPKGILWLDRDVKQQAKSHLKFLALLAKRGIHLTRQQRREHEKQFARDARLVPVLLRAQTERFLRLRFENILAAPYVYARAIADFCGGGDVDAMARAVVLRPPECLPGLLELHLQTDPHAPVVHPFGSGADAS